MRVSIYLKAEELSFKESKVKVRDGLPFLVEYNHQVSTENYLLLAENLENFYFAFKNYFQARISYYSVVKSIDKLKKYFGSNWHPMGTTRLGLDQNNSVCDENLQVYGLENLFLVGASVFPTGSNTNPTFTSLALAHRLAESFHFHEPKN
jgi:choline dehydrogenase-like flavoprotein